MTRLVAALTISVALISMGCVTPFVPAQPEDQTWAKPAEGTVATAYVGDPFLSVGRAKQQRAIVIPSGISTGGYSIAPGEYLVTYMRPVGIYRAPIAPHQTKASGTNSFVNALLTGQAPPVPTFIEWKAEAGKAPELCANGSCRKNPAAKLEWVDVDSFEQRLIYAGRSGKVIRVEYREFSSDMARGAFTTELIFDMGKSRVIGVKGSRIEVLGLSNQAIKFRILNSFTREEKIGRKRSRRRAVAVPAARAQ
jgi:hypothetical protein